MSKSKETFNKREREKKRLKKKQDKQRKKEERRATSDEEDTGEDSMIAWVDEDGNISDTPPDPTKIKKIKASSIEIGVPKQDHSGPSGPREGKVAFFDTSKGYGFIYDNQTQEKYFVHVSGLRDDIAENDKVSFELERGQRGMNAVRVKKI